MALSNKYQLFIIIMIIIIIIFRPDITVIGVKHQVTYNNNNILLLITILLTVVKSAVELAAMSCSISLKNFCFSRRVTAK